MSQQNIIEHLKDQLAQGLITVDEANVKKVRMLRVELITEKLTMDVRRALNKAVKEKRLCRLKKDGHKPEAYFHPNFEHLAKQQRADREASIKGAAARILNQARS